MKKTFLSIILVLILLLVPTIVYAGQGDVAQVGTKKFKTLEEALNVAMGTEEEVTLLTDVTLTSTYQVTDDLKINLGEYDITGPSTVFHVQGAEFTVKGNGTIKEEVCDVAAIYVRGSDNVNDKNYTVVNLEPGVKLEGWSGILIKGPKNNSSEAYGVVINCNGVTMNSEPDTANVTGHGIYINGNVKNQENPVTINVTDTIITSKGTGIYAGGYGVWNITNTTIKSSEMAFGIKAGTLVLNNVNAEVDGPAAEPEGNGNGITATGAVIQIEEYKNYAGKIHLTVNSGNYTSKNNSAILEYTTSVDGVTFLEEIQINGGTFNSPEGKDVITLSESFEETIKEFQGFIKKGAFTSEIDRKYLANGVTISEQEGIYRVGVKQMVLFDKIKNGEITASLYDVVEGEKVILTVTPDAGYELKSLKVQDQNGNEIELKDNSFIMPETSVRVSAEFSKFEQEVLIPEGIEDVQKIEKIIMESLKENEDLKEVIENSNIEIKLEMVENKITETRKEEIEESLKENMKVAKYVDITIYVNEKNTGATIDTIDQLKENIKLTIEIPQDLPKIEEGFARKYYIIRNHNGLIKYLEAILSEDGNTLSFETDRFSAYALAYIDEEIPTSEGNLGDTIEEPKEDEEKEPTISNDPVTDPITDPTTDTTADANNDTTNNNNIPNTGDNIVLYVILAIIAICGIVIAKKVNTKNSKH